MITVLEQTLLSHAAEELCEEHGAPEQANAGDLDKHDMEEDQ